jgi:hypothetical protein
VAHTAVGLAAVADTELDDSVAGLCVPRRRRRRLPHCVGDGGTDRGLREGDRCAGTGQHNCDVGAAGRARIPGANGSGHLACTCGGVRLGCLRRPPRARAAKRRARRDHYPRPDGLPKPGRAARGRSHGEDEGVDRLLVPPEVQRAPRRRRHELIGHSRCDEQLPTGGVLLHPRADVDWITERGEVDH